MIVKLGLGVRDTRLSFNLRFPRRSPIWRKGLVTNYGEGGGLQNGRGGGTEVLPLRKGGGRKSFSHAEGGAQKNV